MGVTARASRETLLDHSLLLAPRVLVLVFQTQALLSGKDADHAAHHTEERPVGIEFEAVSKVYPGSSPAVTEFSLTVPSHRTVVLVGSSGSGKTTLLRMVNRMVEPTSGRVLIDGTDVATHVVPVASDAVDDAASEVVDEVSAKLTTEELMKLNSRSTEEKLPAADIAGDWLSEAGLK